MTLFTTISKGILPYTLIILGLFFAPDMGAQSVFEALSSDQIEFAPDAINTPDAYAGYRAEDQRIESQLEKVLAVEGLFDLPGPDGEMISVRVKPYALAESEFYAKFPEITTFSFRSEDGVITGFGAMSPRGFHAVGRNEEGQFYLDPTSKTGEVKSYASYYTADYSAPSDFQRAICEVEEDFVDTEEIGREIPRLNREAASINQERPPLRQYRLVVSTTAEYSQYHGGTKSDVASELVNLMIRVNEIMRREFSIEYILVDGTDTLFYLDPDEDGYTDGDTEALINQVNAKIPQFFDDSLYDIGHVLCTNAGGLASVSAVCNDDRKRRGVSCSNNPIGDRFYVDLVCHEIGHQMGSRHSFNHCRGDNESLPDGYEPGSGTTIMAYAGLCGSRNVSNFTDPYYNIGSIESIIAYMHEGFGARCAEEMERPGEVPTLDLTYEETLHIPISTPFELTAAATEEDPNLLYCWEQYDASPSRCNTNSPTDNCPLFRSFPPTTDSTRVFPRIQNLIDGVDDKWEKLPDYDRTMQFMCTLRDWDPEGGTLDWDMATLDVTSDAGPFTVEDISGNFDIGEQIEVQWDVAGTDAAPINCNTVDIYLSQDGGFTYPHLIAEDVPNNGRIALNAPNIPTGNAKIKVKASDNVFFNISGSTFRIRPPSGPGFTASYPGFFQNACLPEIAEYELTTASILSFDEEIFIADVQGLPATATWEAVPPTVSAGENILLQVDYGDEEKQELDLQVLLTSELQDTVRVEIQTAVITNDFSDLIPREPARNAESVSTVTDFSWETSEDALEYRVALSASPDFDLIEVEAIVSADTINFNSLLGHQLENGRTYFWRVYPINECGEGEGSVISAFRTGAVSCERYTAIDLPTSIRPTSNAIAESVITVPAEGVVDAVEVRNLRGTHSYIGEIRARLESPAGTAIRLFTERCFNQSDFDVNFSDLASGPVDCPLIGGNTYLPQDELGTLSGESTAGDWKLIIEDRTAGNGGSFQNWELELCGALVQAAPDFSKDTLYVSRGNEQFLTERNLQAEKSGVDPSKILYTVVDGPQNGVMTHGTSTVTTGSQFTQWAVDRWHLIYQHNGSQEDLDYITFTIEDEEGGWIGIDTLPIKVDEILRADNPKQAKFELYPNPTLGEFFIHPPKEFQSGHIQLYDSRGVLMREKAIEGQAIVRMHRQSLAAGVYYIQLKNGKNTFTQKLILQ